MNRSSTEESNSGSEVQPTSTDLEEVIEVDMNKAYITNTIHTESNIAYSTPAGHNTMPRDYNYVVL